MRCKVTAGASSSRGGDIAGGAELSGSMGTAAREGNRSREERGSAYWLTASAGSARVRSGTPGSSRIDGEDPRRPEAKLATATAPRGAPSCVARRGGRGGRGGAGERVGEARGGRWRRLWRTAAMVVFGRERESEGEEGKNRGRVRESRGRAWRRSSPSRRGGEGQAGRRAGGVAQWRARAPGTLPSLCRGQRRQRRETGWAACWLGRPAGWAAQGGAPGKLLLLLFIFVF